MSYFVYFGPDRADSCIVVVIILIRGARRDTQRTQTQRLRRDFHFSGVSASVIQNQACPRWCFFGKLSYLGPYTRPIHALYAPYARPIRALYAPYTRPIRALYAPYTCPIRALYVPYTCPIRALYVPYTRPRFQCPSAARTTAKVYLLARGPMLLFYTFFYLFYTFLYFFLLF